ncbi:MAG: hypothetical protein ABJQ90_18820, partial [Parasphingorhabdus sp.]
MCEFLTMALTGLTLFFVSGEGSTTYRSDPVDWNVTSEADIHKRTLDIKCMGQGSFNIKWYSSQMLSQWVDMLNTKCVTETGYVFPTICGGSGLGDSHGGADGSCIFSGSNGSTFRLCDLVRAGGRADN